MRKKVGNEEWVTSGRRKREESMTMAHKKAAAVAWYRHGRKGINVLGSGKGKMQNPLSPTLAGRHQGTTRSSTSVIEVSSSYDDAHKHVYMSNEICGPVSSAPCHSTSPLLHQPNVPSPVLQASRFKAEALALQSSSSSPSLPHVPSFNNQQLINMSTSQSLTLLSLLPHHQSQKCFNLSKRGYSSSSNNNGNNNNNDDNNAAAWDCGSSLYDSFELLCLSNQLGRCLTTVNAATMVGSASSNNRLLKNLTSPVMHIPPLQPSYIPRSLYNLPQFMIPNYFVKKASKKRSSLIHPIFTIPSSTTSSSPSLPLPALPISPSSQSTKSSSTAAAEDDSKKKAESGGFRRVFNNLLKSLHMKEDPTHHKPKRSNLSEELEKLPKHRPLGISRGLPLLHDGATPAAVMASSKTLAMASKRSTNTSSSDSAMASKKLPTSSSSYSSSAAIERSVSPFPPYYQYHHNFRNEGFRTTSIRPPKSVKWAQPSSS